MLLGTFCLLLVLSHFVRLTREMIYELLKNKLSDPNVPFPLFENVSMSKLHGKESSLRS
jgi:hypothetical protein